VFETEEVGEVGLKEVGDKFFKGEEKDAESVLGSNARIRADKAKQILRWIPQVGEGEVVEEIGRVFGEMFSTGKP
jgi:hypothetical protein